jgi:heme A synthase
MSLPAGLSSQSYRRIAMIAAGLTVGLITLGGVVRITGSGMGCGDHWPLCNGRLFPNLSDSLEIIEWSHRWVAAMVSATAGTRRWRGGGTAKMRSSWYRPWRRWGC